MRSLPFGAVAVAAMILLAGPHAAGQGQEFSVASVKANSRDGGRGQMAFGTDQIVGGPAWLTTDRFDVDARGDFALSGFLPGRDGSPPAVYVMVERLLEDRFKLTTHREVQERPVYALVLARNDRQLGPGLRLSNTDCDAALAASVQSGRPRALAAPPAAPPCSVASRPGVLRADSIPLRRLASALSSPAARVVIDRTELAGVFKEQLGLKLESTSAPIDVLVVDHAERPTPN